MKRIFVALCMLCLSVSLTACKETNISTNNVNSNNNQISEEASIQRADIVKKFFDAFEKGDYETMKTYCTEECINTYFHDDDVFGMIWAKATNIEEAMLTENESRFFVDVETEASEISTLDGQCNTSFYVVMEKLEGGSWLINSFVTG